MRPLFGDDLGVINVGLPAFAETIAASSGRVVDLDWRPPAGGNIAAGRALAGLVGHRSVDEANRVSSEALFAAQPVVRGVRPAREAIAGLGDRSILHAGPPIAWDAMCGPMRGAIIGAILFEGWAPHVEAAVRLAASGHVEFAPCHDRGAVGPMAGVISPSMPVWVVEETTRGGWAYSNLNEGLGKVLRFGAFAPDVLDRLRWMATVLGPALDRAVVMLDGIAVKPLIAQALHMGDECHNRNLAATSLLFRALAPAVLRTSSDGVVLDTIAANDHFFLNISMAACKAMLDAAHGIAGSSLVTAMARNGVEFGIRVSGTGDRWFVAPAPAVDGLYFPGYTRADAAPDLGDSTITETAGLGGFAMAASPAIVQFVGGKAAHAIANTREMSAITLGGNPAFTLPPLDFAPTPSGIDACRVVDTGIAPVINTGIAHRDPGVGQIGAGITRAPMGCFVQAVAVLADQVG